MVSQLPQKRIQCLSVASSRNAIEPRTLIVSGGLDSLIRVWDSELRCVNELNTHTNTIECCVVSRDLNFVLSGSHDASLAYWSLEKSMCVARVGGAHGSNEFVTCCALENAWAVSGGSDWELRIWDAITFQNTQRLSGHSRAVRSVCVAPTRSYLISSSDDKSVILFGATLSDSNSFQKVATFTGHESSVGCVAISPDGAWCASGDDDGSVRIWDTRMMKCQAVFSHHSATLTAQHKGPQNRRLGPVTGCEISSDGKTLVTIGKGICVWDTQTWTCVATDLDNPPANLACCAFVE
eukprot:c9911_g1_i1.p1 GENE.c9911_g1_i1~~c9911_g1_i1.p1  ORF type:complete len:295 (+),score=55.46 c9911_g1_i1:235-1119(+)